jgi:hypothetical protein
MLTTGRFPAAEGLEEAPTMGGGKTGAVRPASASTSARATTMCGDSWLGELWGGVEEDWE